MIKDGTAIDLRYVTSDGKGCNNYKNLTPAEIDLNNHFLDYTHNAGFTGSISGGRVNTTRYRADHSDHLHINR